MKLTDLVDVEVLQKIQDQLGTATDITAATVDLEGEPITVHSTPRRICLEVIRSVKEGREGCRQSDLSGGQQAFETRQPAIYRCHAGLVDFAVPIEVEGELVAYMFGGQILTEPPDLEKHHRYALELGLDAEEYLQALEEVPIVPWPRIEAAAHLMYTIANLISDMARQKLAAEEQAEAMTTLARELSSPVVPVFEGILVLPLIGSIDTRRAQQIMASLLEGIVAHQARVVIIDITGVSTVDTWVANHLIQAIQAAGLLGTESLLVGITPEVAQTIIQLGVDLSGVITRSDLQSGVEYALRLMGLRVTSA
jgi:ligand-binding sensor protein/anti-anti-sigma regulatory factor